MALTAAVRLWVGASSIKGDPQDLSETLSVLLTPIPPSTE